jgi:hypothetical protein
MAIIKLGMLVTGIRGTVGGVTYSANRSGPYARIWSKGADPVTALQSAKRRNLSTLPAQWRLLSGAQRTAWDVFAAAPAQALINSLGETYYISGFLWCVKINRWRYEVGQAFSGTVPTLAKSAAPTANYVRWVAPPTSSIVAWAVGGVVDPYVMLFVRLVTAATPNVCTSGYKICATGAGAPATQLYFGYSVPFGVPGVGYRQFFRLSQQNAEGYRSAAQSWNEQYPYTGGIP